MPWVAWRWQHFCWLLWRIGVSVSEIPETMTSMETFKYVVEGVLLVRTLFYKRKSTNKLKPYFIIRQYSWFYTDIEINNHIPFSGRYVICNTSAVSRSWWACWGWRGTWCVCSCSPRRSPWSASTTWCSGSPSSTRSTSSWPSSCSGCPRCTPGN